MTRVDRYLIGLFLAGLFGALTFFLGLYLVIHFFNRLDRLGEIAENFREAGWSPFLGFCRYYALNIPFVLAELLPFAVLAGGLWAIQQMARRNELVLVVSGGVSLRRLGWPLLLSALVIGMIFAVLKEKALPALAPLRHEVDRIVKGHSDDNLREIELLRDGRGHLVSLREFDVSTDTAWGVTLKTAGKPTDPGIYLPSMTFHRTGESEGEWRTKLVDEAGVESPALVPTDLSPHDVEIASRNLMFLPVGELQRLLDRRPERIDVAVLLHSHFAFPFRVLVLLFLGLPLVLSATLRSAYLAVTLSIIISMLSFAAHAIGTELGRRGELLSPVAAAWAPILLCSAIGIVGWFRVRT